MTQIILNQNEDSVQDYEFLNCSSDDSYIKALVVQNKGKKIPSKSDIFIIIINVSRLVSLINNE